MLQPPTQTSFGVMGGIYTLESALLLHIVAATLLFAAPVVSFAVTGLFLRRSPEWKRLGNLLLIGWLALQRSS